MPVRFTVRHHSFYRSRLHLPLLKGNAALCREVAKRADLFPAIDHLEARPRTGSLILLHRQGFADFKIVVAAIETMGEKFAAPPVSPTLQKQTGRKRYHVSGFSLLCSGLYLLYHSVKRVVTAAVPFSLFQLPALITLGLAWPIQRQAVDNLRKNGRPDMGMISTGLLYYSLFAGNVLAAYTIFWLFNLSSWLESRIQRRTRQTIRDMLLTREESVWLQRNGAEIEVAASSLQPGDRIVLRLGSVVPVDGIIRQGQAFIDESLLTGEAQAMARTVGDQVLSGTVVSGGEIVVTAEKTGEETRIAGIVRMVETAENDPGDMQRFSQRLSQTMVPLSIGIATAGFLITGNMMQAMALVVIGCPCVLRLSSSVAVSTQVARASQEGILIKGGRYLELAARMDTLVVDKTGTLTVTDGQQPDITVLDHRFSRQDLLQLAASMQQVWPHPAGRQLQTMAAAEGLELLPLEKAAFTVGAGVGALLDGEEILFGSKSFLIDAGVPFPADKQKIIAQYEGSGSRLLLARNGQCLALFTAGHKLRGGERAALARLRTGGIRHLVLLSGDSANSVENIGRELGFDLVLGGRSPEEKAAWITAYRQKNPAAIIGMVGDGINDTPAFAAADIGIAIADGGADVTVEYGDIVVQYGGITQVARLQELAMETERKIKKGYSAAIGLNSLAIVGTASGLFSPLTGALIHNGITVAVVGYAAAGRRQQKNFY